MEKCYVRDTQTQKQKRPRGSRDKDDDTESSSDSDASDVERGPGGSSGSAPVGASGTSSAHTTTTATAAPAKPPAKKRRRMELHPAMDKFVNACSCRRNVTDDYFKNKSIGAPSRRTLWTLTYGVSQIHTSLAAPAAHRRRCAFAVMSAVRHSLTYSRSTLATGQSVRNGTRRQSSSRTRVATQKRRSSARSVTCAHHMARRSLVRGRGQQRLSYPTKWSTSSSIWRIKKP